MFEFKNVNGINVISNPYVYQFINEKEMSESSCISAIESIFSTIPILCIRPITMGRVVIYNVEEPIQCTYNNVPYVLVGILFDKQYNVVYEIREVHDEMEDRKHTIVHYILSDEWDRMCRKDDREGREGKDDMDGMDRNG